MPDTAGKLDGLRDIIHPSVPVVNDYSVLVLLGVCVLIILILAFSYRQYQQRRLIKARQYFNRLKRNRSQWTAHQCGESMMTILRLYSGEHNVKQKEFKRLDDRAWSLLIATCNQLRFSMMPVSNEVLEETLAKIEVILWPRR